MSPPVSQTVHLPVLNVLRTEEYSQLYSQRAPQRRSERRTYAARTATGQPDSRAAYSMRQVAGWLSGRWPPVRLHVHGVAASTAS